MDGNWSYFILYMEVISPYITTTVFFVGPTLEVPPQPSPDPNQVTSSPPYPWPSTPGCLGWILAWCRGAAAGAGVASTPWMRWLDRFTGETEQRCGGFRGLNGEIVYIFVSPPKKKQNKRWWNQQFKKKSIDLSFGKNLLFPFPSLKNIQFQGFGWASLASPQLDGP